MTTTTPIMCRAEILDALEWAETIEGVHAVQACPENPFGAYEIMVHHVLPGNDKVKPVQQHPQCCDIWSYISCDMAAQSS